MYEISKFNEVNETRDERLDKVDKSKILVPLEKNYNIIYKTKIKKNFTLDVNLMKLIEQVMKGFIMQKYQKIDLNYVNKILFLY